MDGNGVVDSGSNSSGAEPLAQRIALGKANHILVKDMVCIRTTRRNHQWQSRQSRIITGGNGLPPRIIPREAPELDIEDRGLDRIEARIDAGSNTNMTFPPTILANFTQGSGNIGIIGDGYSAIADRTEILGRIKAKT